MNEYFYIYKITCTAGSLKDHYYIGQRKCHCLPENDTYKGSGRVIKDYYKKYPNDYIKEILCYCKDENELNEKEDFYVGDLYDTGPMCLNLCAGGHQPGISEETHRKQSEIMKGKYSGNKNPMYGRHHKEETIQKISQILSDGRLKGENHPMYGKGYKISGENNPMYGKHLSEEACRKKSKKMKGKFAGDKNPRAKKIYVDGQIFACMKYAAEFINTKAVNLRMFTYNHNSGDYYKGHKIEWE